MQLQGIDELISYTLLVFKDGTPDTDKYFSGSSKHQSNMNGHTHTHTHNPKTKTEKACNLIFINWTKSQVTKTKARELSYE